MLADVGMMKTYSNSTHVNDLGFAWTGPSSLLHGPTRPSLCMDWPSSLFLQFFCQVVLPHLAGTHCTIPTSAIVFGGNINTHPCFSTFYGMQITQGLSTFMASKQQWQQRGVL